jgi:hypothetical protein
VAGERVDAVLFRYDPEDKIKDGAHGGENAADYKIELIDRLLIVTVNMKSHENYTYYVQMKYDFIFDIRVLQAKRDCVPKLKEVSVEFKKNCGKLIPIEIEFDSWCTHKNFRALANGMLDEFEFSSNLLVLDIYFDLFHCS